MVTKKAATKKAAGPRMINTQKVFGISNKRYSELHDIMKADVKGADNSDAFIEQAINGSLHHTTQERDAYLFLAGIQYKIVIDRSENTRAMIGWLAEMIMGRVARGK